MVYTSCATTCPLTVSEMKRIEREVGAGGVRYRRLSPGELAHSNALTVLDASGAVAYQSLGLGGAGEAVAAVRALAH